MAYLSDVAAKAMGFRSVGRGAKISDKASFYGPERIRIGDDVRIDDFCVLSAGPGGIDIGSNIHVAVYCSLIGAAKIELCDFCNLSSRVAIYSSSDDFSGRYMTNPTVPAEFTNVQHAAVRIGRHAILGCGSVILPGVDVADGAAIGALSLVKSDCMAFTMYGGVPARQLGPRRKDLLDLEAKLRARLGTMSQFGNV